MDTPTGTPPSDPTPAVGRVVHYVSYGTPGGEYKSECRAATITEVGGWRTIRGDDPDATWSMPYGRPEGDGREYEHRELLQIFDPLFCRLTVLNPTGLFFNQCLYSGGQQLGDDGDPLFYPGGTWHWPERV